MRRTSPADASEGGNLVNVERSQRPRRFTSVASTYSTGRSPTVNLSASPGGIIPAALRRRRRSKLRCRSGDRGALRATRAGSVDGLRRLGASACETRTPCRARHAISGHCRPRIISAKSCASSSVSFPAAYRAHTSRHSGSRCLKGAPRMSSQSVSYSELVISRSSWRDSHLAAGGFSESGAIRPPPSPADSPAGSCVAWANALLGISADGDSRLTESCSCIS
jgi:hypothetical protein